MRTLRLIAVAMLAALTAGAQDASEKLYSAIRANDLPGLKALLDQGVSADTAGARDVTPLMAAAEAGSAEAMKLLLDRGAAVNAQNGFGSTALMWSAGDAQKVKLLLDRGADVNLAARSGRTALIVAASANPGADAVRMLLAKGAKVAVMDQRKVTPMSAATFGNDTATIRLLADAGADLNTADTFIGITPLMNAAGNRNVEAVKLLLAKGAQVNAVSMTENLPKIPTGTVEFGGWTPLLMAAPYGPPELVQTLLDAGAKVNVQDYRGFTPLMLAIATDRYNPEIVKMLLAHGADAGPKTHAGETALDWARKFSYADVIKALGGPVRVLGGISIEPPDNDLRPAIARGMALLDKTTTQFYKTAGCMACHEQPAGEFAAAAVRAKGIPVDEKASKDRRVQITTSLNGPAQMEGPAGIGGADNNIYAVEGLMRSGYAPDKITDYLAASLALAQGGDGGWHLPGYSRSPIQDTDFSRTAIGLRALKTYGTPGRAAEMKDRIERAKQWLLHAEPVILEDFDWRLVGAAAAGAAPAELRKLAEPILTRQRSDGGWAQRDNFATDAYATGMTLWALAEAGVVAATDRTFQRGVNCLLRTQSTDGSWRALSRATKFQEYFESGFPYKDDQWISTMATGWAVNALALAVPAPAAR
jgi:ankyrin repeat protein